MLRAWADSYQHEAVYQSIRGVSSPRLPSEVKTERMTLQLLAPHICSRGVGGKRWTLEVRFSDYWGGGNNPQTLHSTHRAQRDLSCSRPP